jgi:RHS repeat-associated protein
LRDQSSQHNGTLDQRLYALQDDNGNITALRDGNGNVLERYLYDPYGTVTVLNPDWSVRAGGSAYALPYLFQGGRYDAATGAYHFGWRELLPGLGRWLQQDPLGYSAGDVNLYRFVGNAPLTHTDPLGLSDDDRRKAEERARQKKAEEERKDDESRADQGVDHTTDPSYVPRLENPPPKGSRLRVLVLCNAADRTKGLTVADGT